MTAETVLTVVERVFCLADLGPAPPPGPVRGLLAAVGPASPGAGGGSVWYTAGPGDAGEAAVRLASQPRVRAVAFHPHQGGDPAALRLPLLFAGHLAAVRRLGQADAAPVTVSDTPPVRSSRLVRIPHLAAFGWRGTVADVVVWELLERDAARRWLGGQLPDTALLERRLPRLLTLRRQLRSGRAPDSAAGRRLRTLLAGRYLSIRLVWQHPDLFTDLTDTTEVL